MERRFSLEEFAELLKPFALRGELVDRMGVTTWEEFLNACVVRYYPEDNRGTIRAGRKQHER